MKRWTSATFAQFRKLSDTEESTTCKYIDFVTEYQKELPEDLLAEADLHNHLRAIFCSVSWCEIIFRCTEAHENVTYSGQKLISAYSNANLRSILQPKSIALFYASQSGIIVDPSELQWSQLVAFFLKTPLRPGHQRPQQFSQENRSGFRSGLHPGLYPGFRPTRPPFERPQRPSWMRPSGYQRSQTRPKKVYFGCHEEEQFLRYCPNSDRHINRFQFFCDIADAAAYFMSHSDQEVDQTGHEALVYYYQAEEQLADARDTFHSAVHDLDAWFADMFAVLDNIYEDVTLILSSSVPLFQDDSYGFIPMSIVELKEIIEIFTIFSSLSAEHFLLVYTGAPRSICSEEW